MQKNSSSCRNLQKYIIWNLFSFSALQGTPWQTFCKRNWNAGYSFNWGFQHAQWCKSLLSAKLWFCLNPQPVTKELKQWLISSYSNRLASKMVWYLFYKDNLANFHFIYNMWRVNSWELQVTMLSLIHKNAIFNVSSLLSPTFETGS